MYGPYAERRHHRAQPPVRRGAPPRAGHARPLPAGLRPGDLRPVLPGRERRPLPLVRRAVGARVATPPR
ncbi:hypothetical protein ACRAWF_28615 [Streptomyces sp. L7]